MSRSIRRRTRSILQMLRAWLSRGISAVPQIETPPEPSYILAQMVCAELLSMPVFKREQVKPPRPHDKERDAYFLYKEQVKTDKCVIVWYWSEINLRHPDAQHQIYGVHKYTHEIFWAECKPFGSSFNERERKLIEAAIEQAESLQSQRDKCKAAMDRQQSASDALANWMGVEA